jgi:hypothetical protein
MQPCEAFQSFEAHPIFVILPISQPAFGDAANSPIQLSLHLSLGGPPEEANKALKQQEAPAADIWGRSPKTGSRWEK